MNKLAYLALYFAIALACEKYCNGHGTCGAKDKCECYMGWGGSDCSLRACPSGEAFADTSLGDLNHDGNVDDTEVKTEWKPIYGPPENLKGFVTTSRAHRYVECSNAGICDHKIGECTCYDGYEGSACQRRSCPTANENVCSGHGYCLSNLLALQSEVGSDYYGWETEKFYNCKCDNGWEGIDCNSRTCPKGLDPVTLGGYTYGYEYTVKYEGDKTDQTPSYYLYFEYDGIVYRTPEIGIRTPGTCDKDSATIDTTFSSSYGEEIRRGIQTIPPLSQSTVTVTCNTPTDGNNNQGLKVNINVEYADINKLKESTFSPIKLDDKNEEKEVCMNGDNSSKDLSACLGNGKVYDSNKKDVTDKLPQQQICSNRGLCDYGTGLCGCFSGYLGAACEKQQSIAL